MGVTAIKPKNAVESIRDVVQDLLVPDLKAIKVELESQRREMHSGFDAVRTEMHSGFDAIRTEMKLRDEKQTQALHALSDKVGLMMEVRERLAVLEDRSKRD